MLPLRRRCASYTSHYIRRTFVCDGTSMVDHFIQKVVEEKVRLAPIRPLVQNRLAARYHAVGLRSDGTVVAVGHNEDGRCDVSDWRLFPSAEKLIETHAQRRAALESERARLQAELPNLRGVFSGFKRKQIEARLAEIEKELEKL